MSQHDRFLPTLAEPTDREAVRLPVSDGGHRSVTHRELAGLVAGVAPIVAGHERVAIWATPSLQTAVALLACLSAGVPAVPVNPRVGSREAHHVVHDAAPDLVLAAAGAVLPAPLDAIARHDVDLAVGSDAPPPEPDPATPALIVYTSGTTGPPKGVVLSRRALAADIDALAEAWAWRPEDVLVHALPLHHVHGLVLGLLGPVRLGATLHHLGSFSVDGIVAELDSLATMLFGVPTMYHRLAEAAERDARVATALGRARLLVSGSAALPAGDHRRITAATGARVVERYGMTETLITCAERAGTERSPGSVGGPLPGTDLRLVDDDGAVLVEIVDGVVTGRADDDTVGEIELRGPTLFVEYLGRPDATAEVLRDGWLRTGDMAVVAPDGHVRLVGRRSTDLIKSGGYRIGAGEVENALLDHPSVAEVAVTADPDDDLGERIVAWVVPAGDPPTLVDLAEHVALLLGPHKRPRDLRLLDALPRNDMGKVRKSELGR